MGFDAAHAISALSKLRIDAGADINQPDAKAGWRSSILSAIPS